MSKSTAQCDIPSEDLQTALQILGDVPLIDGHNDWPCNIRGWFGNNLRRADFNLNSVPIGQTDLERLGRGRVGGQFWSAFVSCPQPLPGHELQDEAHFDLVHKTLQQIDLIYLMIEMYPTRFALARNSADILEVFRSGRIACMIGIEGLHQIGNSFSCLRLYRSLGVRYVTLTHNCNNVYADSATAPSARHGGLSELGRRVVREMNRIGLYETQSNAQIRVCVSPQCRPKLTYSSMVDLSHTSDAVQEEVLSLSRAPVIFSHSSCYSLCPHPRNVSDSVLDRLKQNGGVIMICFLRELVTPPNGGDPSLRDVVDHIIYAGERIGYEHVGIGSDFDGMLRGPDGLDEVSHYPQLVSALVTKGVSTQDIKRVIGLNILRVLEEVDSVSSAIKLDNNQSPECDSFPSSWTPEERNMMYHEGLRRQETAGKK